MTVPVTSTQSPAGHRRVAACLALTLATAAAAPSGPTVADVQAAFDAGNYAVAVSAAAKVTAAAGTSPADRSAAYAVKGEAHLRLKQDPQAADAFDRAAKDAPDADTANADLALADLSRHLHGGAYTPKRPGPDGAKPPPLDVLGGPEPRKAAMAALFADELAADGPKLAAAAKSASIPALMQAAQRAATLRAVELAGTGSDEKSGPPLSALSDHARDLLAATASDLAKRVADTRAAADVKTGTYGRSADPGTPGGGHYGGGAGGGGSAAPQKVGLSNADVANLKDTQLNCQRLATTAEAFAKVVGDTSTATAPAATGGGAPPAKAPRSWSDLAAAARQTAADAGDVLTTDYGTGGRGAGGRTAGRAPGR